MARRRRKRLPEGDFDASIESLSAEGRGVAHVDGKTLFLHGGLPGEQVRFRYTRRQKRHDEGIVTEVIEASPDRVEPKCGHFGVCGGCGLQHMASTAQLMAKQQALLDTLMHIGKVEPERVLAPLSNATTWGYRTKARLGVKYVAKKGRVLVGFRERGGSFVADLRRCEVLDERIGGLIEPLAELIGGLSIRDRVAQIEVAAGDADSVLIFRVLDEPSEADLARLRAFAAASGQHIYLQPGGPDSIVPLDEAARLYYDLPAWDLRLDFLPTDFTQVNIAMNRRMIALALDLLALQPDDRVLDLFCGLGNFTLPLARQAREVVGVEGDAGLVQRARDNASRNDIDNARFHVANLYEPLQAEPWLNESFDKVLLDPPRSGAREILAWLGRLAPRHILYVSCYPGTLARDAGELVAKHGYRLAAAGVMDMFPHTGHVESIALFERKEH